MKWEKGKIEDVCNVGDGAHASIKRQSEGMQYLTSKNFKLNGLDLSKVDYISIVDFEKHFRDDSKAITKPQTEDVLLSIIGSLGAPYLVKKSDNFGISSSVSILRSKKNYIEPIYLFYWIKSNEFQDSVNSFKSGVAQSFLSLGMIKGLPVVYPNNISTQRRIGSILSAYDDLIENNLKRIKLLEEKAFLSYKTVVKNEKLATVNKLEEIIETVKRKPKILKSDYKDDGEFPIIDQSTDFIGGYTDEKETVYEDVPMIVFGDHTRILKYINFPFACGADGTQLVKPKNSNVSVAYLYFELISCNLSNYHYARHFKFLKEQVIKLPSEKVMSEYKIETDIIFNLMQVLRLQNAKLREARDILLPRLMSGEIEV